MRRLSLLGLAGMLAACGAGRGAGDASTRSSTGSAITHVAAVRQTSEAGGSVSMQGTITSINHRSGTLELAIYFTWPPFAVETPPRRDHIVVTAHTRFVPDDMRLRKLQVGDAVAVTTTTDATGQERALVLTRLILD